MHLHSLSLGYRLDVICVCGGLWIRKIFLSVYGVGRLALALLLFAFLSADCAFLCFIFGDEKPVGVQRLCVRLDEEWQEV